MFYAYGPMPLMFSEQHHLNTVTGFTLCYGVWRHFQQYFRYIMGVSFIVGENQSTRRKLPTCLKSPRNNIIWTQSQGLLFQQQGPSLPCSYGRWIYNYLQSVPISTNVVSLNPSQPRCTRYNIMCKMQRLRTN
jgi:hypothetical protein